MASQIPRPTLRVIREELAGTWEQPGIDDRNNEELCPVSELPHPLIRHVVEQCSSPAEGEFLGRNWIRCTKPDIPMREFRMSQHRAGVWVDEHGVPWICAVGLAKGNHKDFDDFYVALERLIKNRGADELRPSDIDRRLLKRELVQEALVRHEISLQIEMAGKLRELTANCPGESDVSVKLTINNPLNELDPVKQPNKDLFTVTVSVARNEELGGVEVIAKFDGDVHSPQGRALKSHCLLLLDRHENTGATVYREWYEFLQSDEEWAQHLDELDEHSGRGEVVGPLPPRACHYLHRQDIVAGTVGGNGQRTLCGVYIVPLRSSGDLPLCPECEERHAMLPS